MFRNVQKTNWYLNAVCSNKGAKSAFSQLVHMICLAVEDLLKLFTTDVKVAISQCGSTSDVAAGV